MINADLMNEPSITLSKSSLIALTVRCCLYRRIPETRPIRPIEFAIRRGGTTGNRTTARERAEIAIYYIHSREDSNTEDRYIHSERDRERTEEENLSW